MVFQNVRGAPGLATIWRIQVAPGPVKVILDLGKVILDPGKVILDLARPEAPPAEGYSRLIINLGKPILNLGKIKNNFAQD